LIMRLMVLAPSETIETHQMRVPFWHVNMN
jgi:hypothetical protein